jgi:hypothetical protein
MKIKIKIKNKNKNEGYIPVDHLPDCLKSVTFHVGLFKECSANATKANNYGMNFISYDMKETDMKVGRTITLDIKNLDYKLRSRVIYVKSKFDPSIQGKKVSFGITFDNFDPFQQYHELLHFGNKL